MSVWTIARTNVQGINCAVVSVKDHIVANGPLLEQVGRALNSQLRVPVVLVSEANRWTFGPQALIDALQHVHPQQLPWRQVHLPI